MKAFDLTEVQDKLIGKIGTTKRDLFELEMRLDQLGQMIQAAKKERQLNQQQLKAYIGIKIRSFLGEVKTQEAY